MVKHYTFAIDLLGVRRLFHVFIFHGKYKLKKYNNKETRRIKMGPTLDEIMDAVEDSMMSLSSPGFCRACGEQQDGCEPDARNYECESCGENEVFGAEELLIEMT